MGRETSNPNWEFKRRDMIILAELSNDPIDSSRTHGSTGSRGTDFSVDGHITVKDIQEAYARYATWIDRLG